MFKDRQSIRSKSLLRARILLHNRQVTFDCVVRDISSRGAKLEMDPSFVLAQEFELDVPQRSAILHCEVRWRRGTTVGVQFKEAAKRSLRSAPHE